jgi:hypothetical protein
MTTHLTHQLTDSELSIGRYVQLVWDGERRVGPIVGTGAVIDESTRKIYPVLLVRFEGADDTVAVAAKFLELAR